MSTDNWLTREFGRARARREQLPGSARPAAKDYGALIEQLDALTEKWAARNSQAEVCAFELHRLLRPKADHAEPEASDTTEAGL